MTAQRLRFEAQVNTGNADMTPAELAKRLRAAAALLDHVHASQALDRFIRDPNGNNVGAWTLLWLAPTADEEE